MTAGNGQRRAVVEVRKTCASCGDAFEASNARRRTCSDRCRKAASRKSRIAPAVETSETPESSPRVPGVLYQVTLEQLRAADRASTPLGILALEHALALDDPRRGDTGSSRAALSKEYRAALAEAMRDAETERDDLDEILESATVKLLPGGAR